MWQSIAHPLTLGIGYPGPFELVILAVIGLLIFGKRLPEVGKSIGRGIVEFKRGLSGIDEDIDQAGKQSPKIEQQDAESADLSGQQSQSTQQQTSNNQAHPSA